MDWLRYITGLKISDLWMGPMLRQQIALQQQHIALLTAERDTARAKLADAEQRAQTAAAEVARLEIENERLRPQQKGEPRQPQPIAQPDLACFTPTRIPAEPIALRPRV